MGRWDDLEALYGTPLERDALRLWAGAIKEGNGLAAKWADRQDNKLRKYMKLTPKGFRDLVVENTKVVEQQMCAQKWDEIKYEQVPSVAIGRYNKAFTKHDLTRYSKYRQGLVKFNADGTAELTGEVKAGAIFPHDLVRTVHSGGGDEGTMKLVEGQFLSMPDLFNTTKRRILFITDFSGSMTAGVSGSISAMDIALGLSLYCSDRVGKKNPFYRKFIPFSDNATYANWENLSFSEAVTKLPNGYCGSTNIESALDLVLNTAKTFKLAQSQMPTCFCIISDMQFNEAVEDYNETPINSALKRWTDAGYNTPNIIFWNLMGYKNQAATKFNKHVAMVSGFSPAILKAVLEGDDFTPLAVMRKTLEKYEVIRPNL